MCTDPIVLEGLVSLVLPSFLALILFLSPLTQGSLSPVGRDLMEASHSKVSQSLHIVWLWVSVFVPICYRRKLL